MLKIYYEPGLSEIWELNYSLGVILWILGCLVTNLKDILWSFGNKSLIWGGLFYDLSGFGTLIRGNHERFGFYY